MKAAAGVRLYQLALCCYPRRFREEYGPDMVALLEDQLRDEPAPRVWARATVDLSISIPTRHLEALMTRPPNLAVPVMFAGLSTAGVLLVVIGGARGDIVAMGTTLAVVAGALAYLAWRDVRHSDTHGAGGSWAKLLGAGMVTLASFIAAVNIHPDLSDGQWQLAMLALLTSLALIASGTILGVVRHAHKRAGRSAAVR